MYLFLYLLCSLGMTGNIWFVGHKNYYAAWIVATACYCLDIFADYLRAKALKKAEPSSAYTDSTCNTQRPRAGKS